MRLTCLLFIIIIINASYSEGYTQSKAITEEGDTLVIYSDGTWDYWSNFITGKSPTLNSFTEDIKTNNATFIKPKSAVSKMSGQQFEYELYYDPVKWKRIPPGTVNPIAENGLQMIGGDAYLMLIAEGISIPLENMAQIALINAKKASPSSKIIEQEYRTVNGTKVLCATLGGNISGLDFVYYSYYYSDERGTLQVTSFTSKSNFEAVKKDLEELLNGLVILE